ncbi:MAG: GNAT family N-acetyltransferase [Dehalococcoidia bacterium]
MNIRALSPHELSRLSDIDVGETIERTYRLVDGELLLETNRLERPRWDAAEWAHRVRVWQDAHVPDVWLGAFDAGTLVGEASLRYRLTETMAQLATLHVDRHHRRRGVARLLLAEVRQLAQAQGATSIYVSAAETEAAVAFYLSQGFAPTLHPDPRLYEFEPTDIHMVASL